MKTALIILIAIHGLIHLIGFAKAFSNAEVQRLSSYVSRPLGVLWLVTAILFLIVAMLMMLNKTWWPYFAIAAVILSQTLIIIFWGIAKFGTILNVVILIVGIATLSSYSLDDLVAKEVREIKNRISAQVVFLKN